MFQFTERLGALIGRIFGKLNAILAPETGVKIKASNKVAFIGLHCATIARSRWIVAAGRPTSHAPVSTNRRVRMERP